MIDARAPAAIFTALIRLDIVAGTNWSRMGVFDGRHHV